MQLALLLILSLQLPSKVDGTPLTIPVCNVDTEKLHWNGTSFECIPSQSGSSSTIPVGSILLIDTGTCPTGFTEVSSLANKFLVGTLSTNSDIGITGGADNITPNGTISGLTFTGNSISTSLVSGGTPSGTISQPTFTGSALAAHSHELPFQIATTTTTRQIAAATFGTGTARAATSVSTTGTANTTSAAVALTQSISAGTPIGTISIPTFTGSALGTHSHTLTATGTITGGVFTGNSQDNRPSFVKVIFCKKS